MWVTLGKQLLKSGVKKVAKDRILNRKKKTKKKASGKEVSEGIMNKGKDEKGGALAVRPTTPLVHSAKDFDPVSTTPGESDILIIKKQVIQVRDILKDTHSAKQAERVSQKKAKQGEKRKDREDKIEKSKVEPTKPKAGIKMPKLGGGIGNFFAWLAFGVILNKLWQFLPALIKVGKIVGPIAKFIGGVVEKTFGLIVGSIELAYAGVDKLRELIVGIGGEGAGQLFDRFGKLFTMVMNGALIAATIGALIGQGRDRSRGRGRGKSRWRKGIERWFKKTRAGRIIRNRMILPLKLLGRRFSKTAVGRTLTALRPKNIGRFIMEGGIDRVLKRGGGNLLRFGQNQWKKLSGLNIGKKLSGFNIGQKISDLQIGKKISDLQIGRRIGDQATRLRNILPKVSDVTNVTKRINLGKILGSGTDRLGRWTDRVRGVDWGQVAKNVDRALTPTKFFPDYWRVPGFLREGSGFRKNIKRGVDTSVTFVRGIPEATINAVKSIKWGELPLVKQAISSYKWVTEGATQWIDEVGKNLSPEKMIQGLIDKTAPQIDEFLKNNPALKKLGSNLDPKQLVPWIAENMQKFKTQAEPIANAVRGNKALKQMSNFLGPVDVVVDSMFALLDYTLGKESLVNAVVKALSSTLGFAAGAAAGAQMSAAMTAAVTAGTAGPGIVAALPLMPLITFGMGMGGAFAGEFLGNVILKALVPLLGGIDDPISEELGLGPKKIIRDPWAPIEGEDENLSQIESTSNNLASGLNQDTTYSQGNYMVAENTTTYIQPIEV